MATTSVSGKHHHFEYAAINYFSSEGVSGKNCENAPNRCIGEPCINGGNLCLWVAGIFDQHSLGVCGDFGSRMECNCPKGFVGEGCQYELDACHSNVCKNGASCVQEKDGSYRCICAPGILLLHEKEIN